MAQENNDNNLDELQNDVEINLEENIILEDVPEATNPSESSEGRPFSQENTSETNSQSWNEETVKRSQTQIGVHHGGIRSKSQQLGKDTDAAKGFRKSQEIYKNLQTKLRKVAFDTLASRVFEKLPALILSMEQQQDIEKMPPATKCLFQTLHCTLISRLGQPTNEHEDRMLHHICFGLTKFVENVLENVPQDDQKQMVSNGNRRRYSEEIELGRKALKEFYQ